MTANMVARQLGYKMDGGWAAGENATLEYFRPLETFEERFDALLAEIAALGFSAIDLWAAHLHFSWATPEHIAAARRCLEKHELRVASYAGWVTGGLANLAAACRLCRELRIPLIGGFIELAEKDRPAAVAILRENGVRYSYENHPEANSDDVLRKIGQGDEDVIGVALDTGWFATAGYDALKALHELAPRLLHLHLKDVLAPRTEKSGYMLIDMGHETCRPGQGIVPVEAIVRDLPRIGYRGTVSIEHEPELHDPREECGQARPEVLRWLREGETEALGDRRPMRIAVAGCGNISRLYGPQMAEYPQIEMKGAFDTDPERSQAYVREFGGRAYETLDQLLADPEVDTVVNLTIHTAHPEVIERSLRAGKHVHTEKPLAMTYADCKRLADLADELGLRLSAAPTVWLGEAQGTLWKALRENRIGPVRAVYAEVNWSRIELWHPNPAPFYEVGPVFDVGVYPLTTLTTFFGPVTEVRAHGATVMPERVTLGGEPFSPGSEDYTVSNLVFANGIQCRLTCSFYVGHQTRQKGIEFHGDTGSLFLEAITDYDAEVAYAPINGVRTPLLPGRPAYPGTKFVSGVADLADALREGRTHRTTGRQAAHVVEICQAVHRSIRENTTVRLESRFEQPEPCF